MNRRWILAVLAFLAANAPAMAQTAPASPWQQFGAWLTTQQAYAGLATPITGKFYKTSLAATWWDAAQFGGSGFNVGQGNMNQDYVDLGIGIDALPNVVTRYGLTIPIHVGNIYNSISSHLSSSAKAHINLVAIPNFIIAPQFMYPMTQLSKFTWKNDFFLTFAWGFGGS